MKLKQFARLNVIIKKKIPSRIQVLNSSFQEDLGGSLFNLLDFFPSEECSSILGGFIKARIFDTKNVVGNTGTIQSVIASALIPDEKFYVNAKNEDNNQKYLFKYGQSENSENLELYHFKQNNDEEKKCLTFSADENGILMTDAVNCDAKHRPLCLDFDLEKLSDYAKKCQDCVPNVEECKKWVDLAKYPNNGVTIEGAELCVQPCGQKTYEESNEFCQDLDSSMDVYKLTYDAFVSTSEEISEFIGGESLNFETDVVILDQNDGVIPSIIAGVLEANSVSFEDEFHVFLDNQGR